MFGPSWVHFWPASAASSPAHDYDMLGFSERRGNRRSLEFADANHFEASFQFWKMNLAFLV
jgi:hypothetical protein